ncbi:MAG: hypothetical protein ABI262_14920 [Microcoleus sp.]
MNNITLAKNPKYLEIICVNLCLSARHLRLTRSLQSPNRKLIVPSRAGVWGAIAQANKRQNPQYQEYKCLYIQRHDSIARTKKSLSFGIGLSNILW